MNIIDGIMTRRSIRKFTGELISDEELKTILQAGFQAPSAYNLQAREYIVIQDGDTLEKLENFHPHAKMAVNAGTAIYVCGDKKKQKNLGYLNSDASASIQNMILTAHGLGLGAVWCGIYDVEELVKESRKLLELPDHIVPIGIVVVGKTEIEPKFIDRYDEKHIHKNKWRNRED